MLLWTKNWIVTLGSIVTICFIFCSVLGLAYLIGWSLGAIEAIAAVIVIGFSVDYCLHLGHVLLEAGDNLGIKSREGRV